MSLSKLDKKDIRAIY